MNQNIKKCYGCDKKVRFKRKSAQAVPPPKGDLLLVTRGERRWRMGANIANMYFHVDTACVSKEYDPEFCPKVVTVSEKLKPFLGPEHIKFLTDFGITL